jgi:alpha-aminoadipate/glutamate carrier protein LysW
MHVTNSGIIPKNKEITMTTISCPECEAEIALEAGVEVGEIIVCSDCGVDLEVTSLEPAKVALAPMEEEDWGE